MNGTARFVLAVSLYLCPAAGLAETLLPAPLKDSDFRSYPPALVKLGQLLFYDRVLSGNYRVSCATCHNHDRASSNGFRLDGREEERDNLAVNGVPVYEPFKPSARHAPALFNLGARQFNRLFMDGRVERLAAGRFRSPAGSTLPTGLNDVLSVQALFPAVTGTELIGTDAGNELAALAHNGNRAVWDALVTRVRDLPDYEPFVSAAFPAKPGFQSVSITDIANALGAFVGTEWRSDGSAFDRFLRGEPEALDERQKQGMALFYGEARCSTCHAGILQTDHAFHRTGLPVWRFDADLAVADREPVNRGRGAVTGEKAKVFAYRTPSLRNVTFSPPYGVGGSYATLPQFLRAHIEPASAVDRFIAQRLSPNDRLSPEKVAVAAALSADNDMPKLESISDRTIADLVAFLRALGDEGGVKGRMGKPAAVPSSLALD